MPDINPNQGDNQPDATVEVRLNVPEHTMSGKEPVHPWHEFRWKWPIPAVGSHVNFKGVRFKVLSHEWHYDHLESGISMAVVDIELAIAPPLDGSWGINP